LGLEAWRLESWEAGKLGGRCGKCYLAFQPPGFIAFQPI